MQNAPETSLAGEVYDQRGCHQQRFDGPRRNGKCGSDLAQEPPFEHCSDDIGARFCPPEDGTCHLNSATEPPGAEMSVPYD